MPPKDWYEPLILPGIFTFFGLLTWWMAMMAERKGKPVSWKWIGLICFVLGMVFGFRYFMDVQDFAYRAAMPSNRRFAYAHYLSLLLPAFSLVACVIWGFVIKKSSPPEMPAAE